MYVLNIYTDVIIMYIFCYNFPLFHFIFDMAGSCKLFS